MAYRYAEDRSQPGSYHTWARAKPGVALIRDDEDRRTFESMIDRHLSAVPQRDPRGRPIVSLRDQVRLCARNLLSTHYHLVLWQKVAGGIQHLMRRVIAAYTAYYHRKYGTRGSLFAGPYRADRLVGRKRFLWCVVYVHANHKRLPLEWSFSTHRLYVSAEEPSWLEVRATLKTFGGPEAYLDYMERYLKRKALDNDLRVDDPSW